MRTAMAERRVVGAGETFAMLETADGPGVLTKIFIALENTGPVEERDRSLLESVLRIQVDDDEMPGVAIRTAELFQAHGYRPFKSRYLGHEGLFAARGTGGYLYIQAPYARRIRVTITNGSATTPMMMWSMLHHAQGGRQDWGRQARLRNAALIDAAVPPYAEQVLMEARGRGVFRGLNFLARTADPRPWHCMEGNLRFYVDDEAVAGWESSGTEDYFGGAFFFNGGPFATDYLGLTALAMERGMMAAYRFHIPDPIPFDRGLRVTWTNGERESGNEVLAATTISTNCWYYLDAPCR